MSSGISPVAASCLACEVTATFTIAGVTRAASVSMARSSDNRAVTLLSSRAAAGAAITGEAALADAGLMNSYAPNENANAIAITDASSGLFTLFFQLASLN